MSKEQLNLLDSSIKDVVGIISNNLMVEFADKDAEEIGKNIIDILEKNLFFTIYSMSNLTAKDWAAMELPLRYYVEFRKQFEFIFEEYYQHESIAYLIPKQMQQIYRKRKRKIDTKNKTDDTIDEEIFIFEQDKEESKRNNRLSKSLSRAEKQKLDQSEIFTSRPVMVRAQSALPSPIMSLPPPKESLTETHLSLSTSLPNVSSSPISDSELSVTPPYSSFDSMKQKTPRSLTRSTNEVNNIPYTEGIKKIKKKTNTKSPFIRKKTAPTIASTVEDGIPKNPKYTLTLQGNGNSKSQFLKILLESIGSSSHVSNSKQVSVASKTYDQLVEIQFLDSPPPVSHPQKRAMRRSCSFNDGQLNFEAMNDLEALQSFDPSGNLLIFSVTDPSSFSYIEYLLKSEIEINNPKVPIYLVGLNANQRMNSKVHSKKYISEAEAHELALSVGALHYFEITNPALQFPLLILALGRSCMRKQTFEQNFKFSKCMNIISNYDEQKRKLSLKKKQLLFVPNQLMLLYNLKKLNLTGNLIQYFPVELQFLINLTDLNLSDNFISIIDEKMIANFTKLRRLNLENNQLQDFPIVEAYKMSFVEILLRGNPLSALSSKFKLTGKKSNVIITKIPVKKYPIFGEDLKTLLDCDKFYYPSIHSPLIIQKIFHWVVQYGLDKQGILRATGNQSKINKLKSSLFGSEISFVKEVMPLEISSLLKIFLRELPDPIFPSTYFQHLIDASNIASKEEWIEKMRSIFSLFKDCNVKIIWCLIRLLRMIILNSHINLMPLQNVCKMISPNILRFPTGNQLSTNQQQVNAQISAISCAPIILESLILHSYELFDDYYDPFANLDIVDPDLPIIKAILYQKLHTKNSEPLLSICSPRTVNHVWISLVSSNKLLCRILNAQTLELVKEFTLQDLNENQDPGEIQMIEVGNTVWISNSINHLEVRSLSEGELIEEAKIDDKFKLFQGKKGSILLVANKYIRVFDTKHNLSNFKDYEIPPEEVVFTSFIGSTCALWQCLKKTIRIWDCSENKFVKEIASSQPIIAIENANDDEVWLCSADHTIDVWDVYSVTFIRTISIPSPKSPSQTPSLEEKSSSNSNLLDSVNKQGSGHTTKSGRKQSITHATPLPKSPSFNSASDTEEDNESEAEVEPESLKDSIGLPTQDSLTGLRKIGFNVWVFHSHGNITVIDSETHSLLGSISNFHRGEVKDISLTQGNNKYFKVYTLSNNSLVMWLVSNSPLDNKLKWQFAPALFDFSAEQSSVKSGHEGGKSNNYKRRSILF